jgi:hypothetical protein
VKHKPPRGSFFGGTRTSRHHDDRPRRDNRDRDEDPNVFLAALRPDTVVRCRVCGEAKFAINRRITTGGLLSRKQVVMIWTGELPELDIDIDDADAVADAVQRAVADATCHTCASALHLWLEHARPLNNVLRDLQWSGAIWDDLPDNDALLKRQRRHAYRRIGKLFETFSGRKTRKRLGDADLDLLATFVVLDDEAREDDIEKYGGRQFRPTAKWFARTIVEIFEGFKRADSDECMTSEELVAHLGLETLARLWDAAIDAGADTPEREEIREAWFAKLSDTHVSPVPDGLEPIEERHPGGVHVVGGIPEGQPEEELPITTALPDIPEA